METLWLNFLCRECLLGRRIFDLHAKLTPQLQRRLRVDTVIIVINVLTTMEPVVKESD